MAFFIKATALTAVTIGFGIGVCSFKTIQPGHVGYKNLFG